MISNFFRRPSADDAHKQPTLRRLNGSGNNQPPSLLTSIPLPQRERAPMSPTETAYDRLIFQMSRNDEAMREIVECSSVLRASLDSTARAAQAFACAVGKFSGQISDASLSNSLRSFDNCGDGDFVSEDQKHQMLMAATHQLAKYYSLVSQSSELISVSLLNDFESLVQERQEKHREKCKQWASEYSASVVSLHDYVESMQQMLHDPAIEHKEEIAQEVRAKSEELRKTKSTRISKMIRSERHHYVHFTHRLQGAFKVHLSCFKDLYHQNVKKVPDFIDVSSIEHILETNDRPSQLYLKLRRPSAGDSDHSANVSQDPRMNIHQEEPSVNAAEEAMMFQYAAEKLAQLRNDSGVDLPAVPPKDISSTGKRETTRKSKYPNAEQMIESRRQTNRITVRQTRFDPRKSVASMARIKSILAARNIDSQKALMLYDYEGQAEADMTALQNTEIDVISIEGEWAYALAEVYVSGKRTVKMGWVPLSFTSLCEELDLQHDQMENAL